MTFVIKVHGIPEAVAAFQDLPRTVRNRHMRIAMNAGGGVIRDALVALTPVETGLLKRSYKVKAKVPDASYNVAHHGRPAYAVIGPSRNVVGVQTYRRSGTLGKVKLARIKRVNKQDVFAKSGVRLGTDVQRPSRYFHLLEKGVKAHTISAKSARVLSNGDTVFGRQAQHPGFSGRRIMRSAVSTAGPVAQAKVIAKLRDGIGEWAAKRAAIASRPVENVSIKSTAGVAWGA